MQFRITELNAKLINVNVRPELHGDEAKPAVDLKIETMIPNTELGQFDEGLLGMLFRKGEQVDLDVDHLAALRFPKLRLPIGWDDEVVGGRVTIHRGISAKSDLVLEGGVVNEFRLEPLEGGSVSVTFRVQTHPDEKTLGKLGMLAGQKIVVSVVPPESDEAELPGSDEAPAKDPVLTERTKDGDVYA